MNICFTCGNNLTIPIKDVSKIIGRSAHEKFYKGASGELEEYFKKNETPRCCRTILTTYVDNRYLHFVPN
jgi:DNA-directed RNA polymerase subunit N (RpoN/RPB10)